MITPFLLKFLITFIAKDFTEDALLCITVMRNVCSSCAFLHHIHQSQVHRKAEEEKIQEFPSSPIILFIQNTYI